MSAGGSRPSEHQSSGSAESRESLSYGKCLFDRPTNRLGGEVTGAVKERGSEGPERFTVAATHTTGTTMTKLRSGRITVRDLQMGMRRQRKSHACHMEFMNVMNCLKKNNFESAACAQVYKEMSTCMQAAVCKVYSMHL